MNREGGETVEPGGRGAIRADLPSILAQLDDHVSTEQRAAVRRIRTAIEDREQAAAYVPTVPKLRALLEQPEADFHDEVAACLATLAAEAPTDVAPSSGTLVAVARERADQPIARELLRALAAVAAERPDVVAEHADGIVDVLERRHGYDRSGLEALAHVSDHAPTAVEPAGSMLIDALSANPTENGGPTLRALGRLARSEATVPSLEFVGDAAALVTHDDPSLRHSAIGCLGDVAHRDPAVVASVATEFEAALSAADPDTRALAAATIGRIAAGVETAIDPVHWQVFELLADDHPHVRARACIALGHGGVDAATPRLRDLARTDPSPTVRDRAAWAVRRLS
ncbi:HEAT repeat domain-containing protein [Natrinema sp. HArc-T2]|uniref:HEAT repeat domain-containing protein n=1 Tax=Natrinema sp. HArc-T2 TaxID=3242701 RepID=UPI00359DCA21